MQAPSRSQGILVLAVLVSIPLPQLPAADWPQWRGLAENGISSEAIPSEPRFEDIVWQQNVGIGFSSLAVANDKVFTLGHNEPGKETVWCFDAQSGDPLWSDTYPAPLIDRFYEGGPGATPTVRENKVYTFSKHGRLRSYDASTGKNLWERDMLAEAGLRAPPEWGFACSPYFVNDDLLLIEAGPTFALNPHTGKVIWKSKNYAPAYGTPIAFQHLGQTLVATLKTEGLVILDARDGSTVAFTPWETPFNTNATTPIIDEAGRIFISTGYDRGCALFSLELDPGKLTKIYENTTMCNHMNNGVLIDGHIYGFDGTAHRGRPTEFVCMDFATGKEKWRVKPDEGLGCGSLMAADNGDTLLILTEKGELLSAPATSSAFEWISRAQVLAGRCWTVPVLANGRIYCRNAKGDLVCLLAK